MACIFLRGQKPSQYVQEDFINHPFKVHEVKYHFVKGIVLGTSIEYN